MNLKIDIVKPIKILVTNLPLLLYLYLNDGYVCPLLVPWFVAPEKINLGIICIYYNITRINIVY